jgi:hypothetical protein
MRFARVYRQVAQTLAGLAEPLARRVRERDDLTDLSHIDGLRWLLQESELMSDSKSRQALLSGRTASEICWPRAA